MAKDKTKIVWVGIIITLLTIIAAVVASHTLHGADIEHQAEKTVELKKDGCDPAVQARTDIAVIQSKFETLETGQTAILQAIENLEK